MKIRKRYRYQHMKKLDGIGKERCETETAQSVNRKGNDKFVEAMRLAIKFGRERAAEGISSEAGTERARYAPAAPGYVPSMSPIANC